MHYYAARYYDDHLGNQPVVGVISPDTLAPDATSVFSHMTTAFYRVISHAKC
ncbi:MAG: hypothetical protein R2911_24730 [Caldilineaceae bacterium]